MANSHDKFKRWLTDKRKITSSKINNGKSKILIKKELVEEKGKN